MASVSRCLCGGRLLSRRRGLCSSASARAPLLPRWGSFGKSNEQIAEFFEKVKEDGDRHATVSRELAAFGLKITAAVSRPMSWFGDPEWRRGWIETASEPLDRYARINDRLLDGCEAAYGAIADEFHAQEPDFQPYVESGAMSPELAQLLDEALAKYAAAGRRPVLEQGRCNAQVLMMDSLSNESGFVATVAFRTREARDTVVVRSSELDSRDDQSDASPPTPSEGAPAVSGGMDDPSRTAASAAGSEDGADGGGVVEECTDGGDLASADSSKCAKFEDTVQLWTFECERPNIGTYVTWLRSKYTQDMGDVAEHEDVDPPVSWRLRDINFTLNEYESPQMPQDANEAIAEVTGRVLQAVAMGCLLGYGVYKLATRERSPRLKPLGGHPSQHAAPSQPSGDPVATSPALLSSQKVGRGAMPEAVPLRNQWGDQLSTETREP